MGFVLLFFAGRLLDVASKYDRHTDSQDGNGGLLEDEPLDVRIDLMADAWCAVGVRVTAADRSVIRNARAGSLSAARAPHPEWTCLRSPACAGTTGLKPLASFGGTPPGGGSALQQKGTLDELHPVDVRPHFGTPGV